MIRVDATANHRGWFRRATAMLGSAALAGTLCAQTMGAAPAQAAPSPAAAYRLGGVVAFDGFNRTGNTLGGAFVGGP